MIEKFCAYCGEHLEKTAANEPVQLSVSSTVFSIMHNMKYAILAGDADLKAYKKLAPEMLSKGKMIPTNDRDAIFKVVNKSNILSKARTIDNKFKDRTKKDAPSSFEVVLLIALKNEKQRASQIVQNKIPKQLLTSTNKNLSLIDMEPKLLLTDGDDKKIYAQVLIISLKPISAK